MIRGRFSRAAASAASAPGARRRTGAARRALSALLLAAAASAGCNLIFGIEPGESSGPAESSSGSGAGGSGAGGSNTTSGTGAAGASGGGQGASTSSGTQGGGGSVPDCPPSDCLAGQCPVLELTSGYTLETKGMVVTKDRVLWANGGAIDSISLAGGAVTTLSGSSGFGSTIWLALANGQLSWANYDDGVVRGLSLDPESPSPILVADLPPQSGTPVQAQYGRIAARGDTVYWATQQPGAVWRTRADGSQPFEQVTAFGQPIGVAVDATHVYWADAGANHILRKPTVAVGATAEIFAATNGQPSEVFLSDGDVFWVTEGGAVQSKATSAQLAAQPFTYTVDPDVVSKSIVADKTFVYWTVYRNLHQNGQGEVRRAHRGGADMITLTTGPSYFFEITSDCGFLYWNVNNLDDGNPGKVLRMAKSMN